MDRCPFCGSKNGYYMKETVEHAIFFTWDGKTVETGEDRPAYTGKRKYCMDCERIIPRKRDSQDV